MSNLESAHLTLPVGARDHAEGPTNAPVTLVEYGDYECPSCGQGYALVKQVQERLGERLRFVFRNFPLTQMHPHAQHAAEAAEIAGSQGKFRQMHDMLFENQNRLDDAHLQKYAEAIGLNGAQFLAELHAHSTAARVREDFLSGIRSGVNGTPTFFINGARYEGSYDVDALLAALESAA